ncbi:MAG TPA: CPBP family intramembrane glutamic endopeptidase [Actinomycetes bacterium]|nr:CPBP family intramembrane glutamic endopeptidase [Actinomycetes bacterium]
MAVLGLHNIAVHRMLPEPADAALNLLTAAGLMGFARRAGCEPEDLGTGRVDVNAGLRLGLGASAVCVAAVGVLAAVPATRQWFDDQRLADHNRDEFTYHLVRIPLATALAEELQFRSALLALLRQRRSQRAAVAWTSALFGVWHVLPAIDQYRNHPAGAAAAYTRRRELAAVAATAGATAGAGVAFAWLRLRSRSVLAPVLAHAALNISAYLAGRWVSRAARAESDPQ